MTRDTRHTARTLRHGLATLDVLSVHTTVPGVGIWALPVDTGMPPDAWQDILSADDVRQIDRLRRPDARAAKRAARILLRFALADRFDRPPASWRFVVGKYGRPMLADDGDANIAFSVTRPPRMVAVAVSHSAMVGLDFDTVERLGPILGTRDRSAAGEAGGLPFRGITTSDNRDVLESWTLNEAYVKATGIGLFDVPSSIDVADGLNDEHEHSCASLTEWQFERLRLLNHIGCLAYHAG